MMQSSSTPPLTVTIVLCHRIKWSTMTVSAQTIEYRGGNPRVTHSKVCYMLPITQVSWYSNSMIRIILHVTAILQYVTVILWYVTASHSLTSHFDSTKNHSDSAIHNCNSTICHSDSIHYSEPTICQIDSTIHQRDATAHFNACDCDSTSLHRVRFSCNSAGRTDRGLFGFVDPAVPLLCVLAASQTQRICTESIFDWARQAIRLRKGIVQG